MSLLRCIHLKRAALILFLAGAALGEDAPKVPFFPHDEDGKTGVSGFEEDWYSKHLRALKEAPLPPLAKDKEAEVYRLTILPSFEHGMMVRISKKQGGYEIVFREEDGKGGYDPGKVVIEKANTVQKKEVEEFGKLLTNFSFFEAVSEIPDGGVDGSEWILEAVKEGKYHVVTRWTPDYETEKRKLKSFVACCQWLIEHSPENPKRNTEETPAPEATPQPTKEEESLSPFVNEWPPEEFRKMGEVLLSSLAKDPEVEIYRFTMRPALAPTMMVTLTKKGDGCEITRRGGTGEERAAGRPDPVNLTSKLSPEQIGDFHKLFEAANFFAAPTQSGPTGLDGADWILEAVRGGKYHAVKRWSPDGEAEKPFVACCQWLKDHAPKEEASKK